MTLWTPAKLGSSLALWLDADDASTITVTSGVVSQWNDKSGNNRHASTATVADRPSSIANSQNSRAIMRFDNDRLNASVPANLFDAGIQITAVFIKTGTANSLEAFPAVRTVAGVGRGFDRYNTGLINNSSGFGMNSTLDMRTATSWMVVSSRTNGSGGGEWKNGTAVMTSTSAYAYADSATQIQIGRRDNDGSAFRGDVAEIIVTQYLSTNERQQLEGYLAWKWGIQSSLAAGHPYLSAAPEYFEKTKEVTTSGIIFQSGKTTDLAADTVVARLPGDTDYYLWADAVVQQATTAEVTATAYLLDPPWSPINLGSSLVAWYDASDASTVTRDASNLVSQWNDKSGNARHATQSTSTAKPTYNAATGRFSFDGNSDFMSLPVSIDLGQVSRCVAAFANIDSRETNNQAFVAGSDINTFGFFARAGGTGGERTGIHKTNTAFFAQGPIVAANTDSVFLGNLTVATWRVSLDGTAITGTNGYTFTSRTGFIGKNVLGGTSYDFLWGTLGELIICSELSLANQQRLEGYMAWKWGTVSKLPANHPYKTAAPTVQMVQKELTASAILIETRTASVSTTALVQQTGTKEIQADASLVRLSAVNLAADAIAVQVTTKDLAASAFVIETNLKDLAADGHVVQQVVADLNADTVVVDILPVTVDVPADAIVQRTSTQDLSGSSIILASISVDLTADAKAIETVAAELTADARVVAWTTASQNLSADGYIVIPWRDVVASAIVASEQSISLTGTGFISTTIDLFADATLAAVHTLDLTASAIVRSETLELVGSAIVKELNLSVQLVASGLVITPGLAELTADGLVVPSVEKTVQVVADAIVIGRGEFTADTVITTEQGSDRYVQFTAGMVGTDIRLSMGERTDGNTTLTPSSTLGNQFVAGFSANAVALAVAVDSRTAVPGGAVTVELVNGMGTLLATAVLPDMVRSASPSTGYYSWYFLKLTNPVPLIQHSTYVIRVTGSGTAPKVIATKNAYGAGMAQGNVVNSFVITDQPGTQFDARPLMLGPLYDGEMALPRASFTLTSRTVDAIWIGEGADVELAPASNVDLVVNKLLYLNHHASLTSEPGSGISHRIRFGSSGGLVVDGTLSMTGQAKDRYLLTAQTTFPNTATLTLEDTPVNWAVGDTLSLPTTSGSFMTSQIAAIAGPTVTLKGNVGNQVAADRAVINVSRNSALEGINPGARAKLWMRRGSTTTLEHVELQKVGQGSTIAPETDASCTLNDVVIWDISYPIDSTAPSAITAGPTVVASDLTIVRAKWGIMAATSWQHAGTLILDTIYNANSGLVISNGFVRTDILANNVLGHPVALAGQGSFAGRIDNPNAKYSTGTGGAVWVTNGVNGSCRITGTLGSTNPVTENLGVIGFDEGTLSDLVIESMSVSCPWLRIANGTGGTMRGLARNCATTSDAIIAGFDNVERFFAGHFVDDLGESAIFDDSVTGLDGFTAAVRTRTEAWNGSHERDNQDTIATDGSWKLTAAAGHLYETQIMLVPVAAGETVHIGCWLKGDITIRLDSDASVTVSDANWTEHLLTVTAAEAGVIQVLASTETTGWLDGIERR